MYDFKKLKAFLENNYKTVTYRDTFHIQKNKFDVFIFYYGVIVTWGLSFDETCHLLAEVKKFEWQSLNEPITETYSFSYIENEEKTRIHYDHLYIANSQDLVLEKLAISMGLAQSIKLAQFENSAEQTIQNNRYIPENLAFSGQTRVSRKRLAKMRGELYLVKNDINLRFDLLDTPEFFWEYPELEYVYDIVASYLEVKPRIEVLNRKLEVIHELLNMLADEEKHKHSSYLEWIIIWLIAIEIIIFVVNDIVLAH